CIDTSADPGAGEIVELRIPRRRRDVADGQHVRIAEADVDVSARVRFDQIAVVDSLASGGHRSVGAKRLVRMRGLWTRRTIAILRGNPRLNRHPEPRIFVSDDRGAALPQ